MSADNDDVDQYLETTALDNALSSVAMRDNTVGGERTVQKGRKNAAGGAITAMSTGASAGARTDGNKAEFSPTRKATKKVTGKQQSGKKGKKKKNSAAQKKKKKTREKRKKRETEKTNKKKKKRRRNPERVKHRIWKHHCRRRVKHH